ncbi:MAG TPA: heavy metal-binding domain-containing protein [Hyphomonadaceae bacterium]|jgi:uncharacterized protein YbjQ (UPF0145 family)|nr:heavy metal-binding domain-containing protein [Hyphomonadaceae bacterium]
MIRVQFLAVAALAALGLSLPAAAQAPRPAEVIVLAEGAATAPVTVLGAVNAEYHQKSIFSKADARGELDKQLRAAAARLGADAVVDVKYKMNSPIMSKKGQLASGTAVKYTTPVAAPVQMAAAPPAPAAVAPAPPVPAPVIVPIPAPAVIPPVAVVIPERPIPAPALAAPAAAVTMTAIALAEGDLPGGRAYSVVGAVSVEGKASFDKSLKQVLDDGLRAKAKALGADAVIQIRYDATGASAQGVAVKLK